MNLLIKANLINNDIKELLIDYLIGDQIYWKSIFTNKILKKDFLFSNLDINIIGKKYNYKQLLFILNSLVLAFGKNNIYSIVLNIVQNDKKDYNCMLKINLVNTMSIDLIKEKHKKYDNMINIIRKITWNYNATSYGPNYRLGHIPDYYTINKNFWI